MEDTPKEEKENTSAQVIPVPRLPGRPSAMTDKTLEKLEEGLSYGLSIEQACLFAEIHPSTYYNYVKRKPGFKKKAALLRENPKVRAKLTLAKAAEKDPKWAESLLRHTDKEYKPKDPGTGAGSGFVVLFGQKPTKGSAKKREVIDVRPTPIQEGPGRRPDRGEQAEASGSDG